MMTEISLPEGLKERTMLGAVVRFLLKIIYRVELRGREHCPAPEERSLILYNPGSIIDTLLIDGQIPGRVTLIADSAFEHKWWMRPVRALLRIAFIDFSTPAATLAMIRTLEREGRCMLFHSGQVNNDARFRKSLEAAGVIAAKAGAAILPVRVDGAASSLFSYARHRSHRRWFPQVTVTLLPPQRLLLPEGLPPRERRRRMGLRMYDLMTELEYLSSVPHRTLLRLLMDRVSQSGRGFIIAEDQDHAVLTYGKLLTSACVLGRAFRRRFRGEERVGFLLPTSLPGLAAFFALQAGGLVPAMLNFTSGSASVLSCCRTVGLTSVLTSRKFLKLADLEPLEQALREAGLRLTYLEDVARELSLADKLAGVLASRLGLAPSRPDTDAAAVMFTSGTEGLPKAVFLSHRNINANGRQALSLLTIGAGDKLFNCLPMFHAFGLGVCTLLPVLAGVRVFLYPSPLHYRIVPKLFYESQSTILCGTDTFCAGYSRYGRPYDFCHARLIIVGAEKMRDSTRRTWKDKYGLDLYEGYGATEASPLLSVNTLANRREGSVGRLVPGVEYRLQEVPGITEEHTGLLWVRGDNIMMGYMRPDGNGVLEPPSCPDFAIRDETGRVTDDGSGWYDTGDIVHVDEDGFVCIRGRAKRFAKVGGEMVSLAAVEEALKEIWPDSPLGVVAVPDPKKGEQLALIIAVDNVTTSRIAAHFASRGLSPLWTPRRIVCVKQAPLLGSGKFDYRTARELAEKGTA